MSYGLEKNPTYFTFTLSGLSVSFITTANLVHVFDEKAYEGIFMGYSYMSKGYRILNKKTMVVELKNLFMLLLLNK